MHTVPGPLPTYNQVTKHNLAQMQPMIVHLLKEAAFIALDAEFTGLGSSSQITRAKDIQERYQHLCALAKGHALVAFGLSLFIKTEPSSKTGQDKGGYDVDMEDAGQQQGKGKKRRSNEFERAYRVHNFNFSMLVERDYMVSPNSMLFLAENGLDLNQWIMEGIPYTGGDRLTNEGGRGNPNGIMRSIFRRIMTKQVPVVVHNGFLDLIFLYHSFYADLPPKLSTFLADLSDMFPGGLFDTKYISDYMTRERSSFLAYLFRKYDREDTRMRDEDIPTRLYSTFDIQPRLPLPPLPDTTAPEPVKSGSQVPYCEDYAFHGVCKKKMRCGKSHDLDLILDAEEKERDSKKRRKHKHEPSTVEAQTPSQPETEGTPGTTMESSESAGLLSLAEATVATEAGQLANNTTISTTPTAAPVTPAATEATATPTEPQTTAVLHQPTAGPLASAVIPASSPVTKETENVVQPGEKFHSAYYDAFMTGTIFLHQLHHHEIETVESQAKNKIYLIGKSFPLNVEKSTFTKYSPSHERQRAQ
ncbi:Target of EGR1, member 1 (Nuclear) [Mortierella hygrophila]|uniref:Target of EGR1, member 1 (Nuclear) n=1 Tax=Mortierella hygrophila TaxID=979708 RepID=A0A9P6K835_9FUNG|nr:Target of EGR1, member 1 (Nuclear) [Mortierella hygrophila]